jgi:hypothetical protein
MTDSAPLPNGGYTDADKENPDERPEPIPVNPGGISGELISYPHWVCWRFVWKSKRGEWSKVPINPETGENAKANDLTTATSFQQALEYHQREDTDTDGLGFIVTGSPFAGVDQDGVFDPATGEFVDGARDRLETLDAPSEFSPGGRGTRTFLIGDLPDGSRKGDPVEMYDSGRYLTVTGQRIEWTPDEIPARDDGEERLAEVHREVFPDDYTEDDQQDLADVESPTGDVELDDEDLIERAKNAENGEKFSRLWNGSTAGYDSHSEADLALCNLLAFWTGGDRGQIDRLFRKSGLMRPKWDDECTAEGDTYGEHTIDKALSGRTEYYDPDRKQRAAAADGGTATAPPAPEGGLEPDDEDGVSDADTWSMVRSLFQDQERGTTGEAKHYAVMQLLDEFDLVTVEENDMIWRYDDEDGVFRDDGKARLRQRLSNVLGPTYSRSRVTDILHRIRSETYIDADEPTFDTSRGYY